jgi:type I restriction enzyme S subunit
MSLAIAKLGEVATFINGDRGKNYPSKGSFVQRGVPFINAGNILNCKLDINSFNYITEEHFDLLSNGKIKENDILFCLRGSLGKYSVVKNIDKGAIASSLVIIRNNEKIDLSYLKHYLGSYLCIKEINNFKNGAAVPNLSAKDLKNFKIPLPHLNQQKKIAVILDAADAYRQKTKALIAKYDELTQSLFMDMFGDPVINPMGWDIQEFGKHIDILTDYHANGSYQALAKHVTLKDELDYALMVRTTDLQNKNFSNGVKYIDEHAYNFLKKTKVFGGEIIINKIGSAGKVYSMPNLGRPVSLGMNAFMLRLKETVNIKFIYFQLISHYGKREINKRVKGAVTKTIRKDAVREIPLIMPAIELQNQFSERVKAIEEQKSQAQASLEKSEDLFNCLLQKAFKGELTS